MADDMRTITIVFRDGGRNATYTIAKPELDRLSLDFKNSKGQGGGVYTVHTQDGREERTLMLHFADVLYIG